MIAVKKLARRESGIALLTTILLLMLMSSLLVGFVILINSGQKLSGVNNDYSTAFYAAEAGMEKLTADVGTLFDTNYSPSATQITNIQSGSSPYGPPSFTGIQFLKYDGTSGYTITYPTDANGNPLAQNNIIQSGTYQGMTALETTYTMNVTARTAAGSEVKLQRTTETVGIPMFQFGVFSDGDLSFFAGPSFNFGGRTHTNGNLFLAANPGPLTLSQNVDAFKDVIRYSLSNGYVLNGGNYTGTVNVFNGSGTRPLGLTEGSVQQGPGSTPTTNWATISLGGSYYAGNLRNGTTGAKQLNLGIVTLGGGTTQAVDVIRRPVVGESATITTERYYAQASFRVLLSDNPADITSLPCVDTTVSPLDLSLLAQPTANWPTTGAPNTLLALLNANNALGYNTQPVPLAASGAVAGSLGTVAYNSANGYWLPTPTNQTNSAGHSYSANSGYPIIKGFIKIEIQTNYLTQPCGSWKDVTVEVLGYGYAGKNLHPYNGTDANASPLLTAAQYGPNEPLLSLVASASQLPSYAATNCPDVHPNAIVRLERVRDNPSNWQTPSGTNSNQGPCGAYISPGNGLVVGANTLLPSDFWPNALFDSREGLLRNINTVNGVQQIPLNGVVQYVEIDVNNLAKYLSGKMHPAGSGNLAYDSVNSPNDFTAYISDRRGNYIASAPSTPWPPLSPSGHETGEYGWEDFVNPASAAGCPNGTFDTGEDVDANAPAQTAPFVYGADVTQASQPLASGGYGFYPANVTGSGAPASMATALNAAILVNPNCTVTTPTKIWPFSYAANPNETRENPNPFFRRAVKLVNGANIGTVMNTCPSAVICGLTIASENMVYIQGDYNCPNTGGACTGGVYNLPNAATSVAGDAVTLLSNNWNDINSFLSPFNDGSRNAVTSYYRTAIMGGKSLSFPQPTGYTPINADFGTDGGLHNFLRYIENWGNQTLYYEGSIVSLFTTRQSTGVYNSSGAVYSPPTRGYNFDVEFLTPTLLPPRTPLFRDVNTTGFTQLLLPSQ
jgi:Tfp pilus assembly protein PilX